MTLATGRGWLLSMLLAALLIGGSGCGNSTAPGTKTPTTNSGTEPEKIVTPPKRDPG